MQLPALIAHAARLFRIIWKSPQPSDVVASHFFREKKYIGSKERRFISESVFASLRMKLLSDYCADRAFETANIILQENRKAGNDDIPHKETAIISATCLIAILYPFETQIFSPEELIINVVHSDELNFTLLLEEALCVNLNITTEEASSWISEVIAAFRRLDNKSLAILERVNITGSSVNNFLQYRYSIPGWILEDWHNQYETGRSWKDICRLAESLFASADVCLRVNTNIMSRTQVIRELENEGIESRESKISPSGVVLKRRVQLNQNRLYKEGIVEVQDEGSQLISYALAPSQGSRILDACAGAGGKTLHIAALVNDNADITASDIEIMRLKEVRHRAARCGFHSITTELLNPKKKVLPFKHEFDYVLIDAPCSGMGTTRRMPMPKWRLTPKLLQKHSEKQYRILNEYSSCVREGGILVYSTCSLMPEENDLVIDRFIESNPDFIPDPLYPVFRAYGIELEGLKENDFKITLKPSIHCCDGFFICRLKRRTG